LTYDVSVHLIVDRAGEGGFNHVLQAFSVAGPSVQNLLLDLAVGSKIPLCDIRCTNRTKQKSNRQRNNFSV